MLSAGSLQRLGTFRGLESPVGLLYNQKPNDAGDNLAVDLLLSTYRQEPWLRSARVFANNNSATMTGTLPNSLEANDAIIVWVSNSSGDTPVTEPTGFTYIGIKVSNNVETRLYTKTAIIGDRGASVTYVANSINKQTMGIAVVGGCDTNSIIDIQGATAETVSTVSHVVPEIEVGVENSLVLHHVVDRTGTPGDNWTAPSNAKLISQAANTGAGATSAVIGVLKRFDPRTGTSGGTWVSSSVAGTSAVGWAVSVKGPNTPYYYYTGFELGAGTWQAQPAGYTFPVTLSQNSDRRHIDTGNYSLKVVMPTCTPVQAMTALGFNCVIGKRYTLRARVKVPTGVASVAWFDTFGTGINGAYTTLSTGATKDAWVNIDYSFEATATVHYFGFACEAATTAGDTYYVDNVTVNESIFDNLGLVWNVDAGTLSNFTDDLSLVWNVNSGFTDDLSLVWNVNAGFTDDLSLVWNVRTGFTDDLGIVWNVRTGFTDDLSLVWLVNSGFTDDLSLVWNINSGFTDDLQLIWNVDGLGNFIDDLSLVWNVNAGFTDDLSLVWNINAGFTDDLSLVWNVRTGFTDDLGLIWNVNGSFTDNLALVWNVLTGFTDDLSLLWNVNAGFTDDLTLLWDTLSSVILTSFTDDLTILWSILDIWTEVIDFPEIWTERVDTPETWTPQGASASIWTEQVDVPETYTPASLPTTTWTEQ